MAVVLAVIHPMSSATIQVHGPIDVYDPEFFEDAEEGFSNVHLELKNNEDMASTYVILLQFQDSHGYATQIVQTELLSVMPDEELLTIVDYRNETGKRLLSVFVWTDLDFPEPIASFRYIGDGHGGSYAEIPVSSDTRVQLSRVLSACEDDEDSCGHDARSTLYATYQRCMDFREFGVESDNSICNDPRISKYSS